MLITDQFVFIHVPKTGGTFVETILQEIHEKRGDFIAQHRYNREGILQRKVVRHGTWLQRIQHTFTAQTDVQLFWMEEVGQHGHVKHIPPQHRHKPIVACVRNPYDHYVSMYEFDWWRKNHPWVDMDDIHNQYPHYPDVTFQEFLDLLHTQRIIVTELPPPLRNMCGFRSMVFMNFFFKGELADILPRMEADYVQSGAYKADMYDNITFLKTDSLNSDLHAFLSRMGYPASEIDFILSRGKIKPPLGGRSVEQKWHKYYTPDIKKWVRERDWLLFELFPEFDV